MVSANSDSLVEILIEQQVPLGFLQVAVLLFT